MVEDTKKREPAKRTLSRRSYLTLQAMADGAGAMMAIEAVSSTAIEHPEWNMEEEKTWTEWEKELGPWVR
jgi:hypothetical protein